MKKKIVTLCIICFYLVACTPAKKSLGNEDQLRQGKESQGEFFIVKPNGEKVMASKIVPGGLGNFGSFRLTVDGVKMYAPADVIAYQGEDGYNVFRSDPKPTKYWKGIWITRLRTGKMNLYYSPTRSKDLNLDFYYFEKEKGKYVGIDYETFSAALQDNPSALEEFRKLFPKRKVNNFDIHHNMDKITKVVDLYNR